jgi:hypothetical protein
MSRKTTLLLLPLALALVVCSTPASREEAAPPPPSEAARPVASLLASNEAALAEDLEYGRFTLRGREEMQKLLDRNRRVALSMQDLDGPMRSTNQYIYYLLWYRDGGMNTAHLAMTGWIDPAGQHVPFALANPNVSVEEPEGRFFGQVMGGPLTKWDRPSTSPRSSAGARPEPSSSRT